MLIGWPPPPFFPLPLSRPSSSYPPSLDHHPLASSFLYGHHATVTRELTTTTQRLNAPNSPPSPNGNSPSYDQPSTAPLTTTPQRCNISSPYDHYSSGTSAYYDHPSVANIPKLRPHHSSATRPAYDHDHHATAKSPNVRPHHSTVSPPPYDHHETVTRQHGRCISY